MITAAMFAVLAILLVAAFELFLPKQSLKNNLLNQIRGYTMRQAQIGGFSASIITGIEVTDFALSNGIDFRSGTLLKVKKVTFIPEIWPMFRGVAKVNGLIIDSPELNINKKEFRLKDVIDSIEKMKHPGHPRKYAPLIFMMSEFRVNDGTINFTDDKSISVNGVNILVRGFSRKRPSKADLSFRIFGKKGGVDVDSDLVLDISKDRIIVENLKVSGPGNVMNITGRITELDNPLFDLRLKAQNNSINGIAGDLLNLPQIEYGNGSPKFIITGTFDNIRIKEWK